MQNNFVVEYLIDKQAGKAAVRAGYSPRNAQQKGSQLLHVPEIAEAIRKGIEEQAQRAAVTADELIAELKKIAFANMQDFVDESNDPKLLHDMDRDQTAAIQEVGTETSEFKGTVTIKRKIKLLSKLDAIEKLGRHIGLFEKDNSQKRAVVKIGFEDEEDDE